VRGVIREGGEISETSRGGKGAVTQSLFYLPAHSKENSWRREVTLRRCQYLNSTDLR
jgi:hypothetical protein